MACYRLKRPWALRGWDKLPYALVNDETKRVVFVSREEFEALSLCDGSIDVSWAFVPPETRELVERIAELGVAEACADGEEVEGWQRYRKYDCRYVKMAHWSITGRCNYRCRHCYMSAPDAKYGELDHDTCMRIIDELADCGVYRMSITGGEPLVRSDFWELIDHMLERGMRIMMIYSNGALVTDEFLDGLEARGIRPEINMSFDGVGWHDWLRGIPGAEETVVAAFKRCQERGFPTAAELCLHKGNLGCLRESVNLLAGLGVHSLKVNPVSNVGNWAEQGEDHSIGTEQAFEAYLDYVPQFFEDGSPMTVHLGGFFMCRKGERVWRDVSRRFCGDENALKTYVCGHARQVMYLSADGRVLPCMALSGMDAQEQFPLLGRQSLKECLSDSAFIDLVTLSLADYLAANPECQGCEHRYSCGAGCRASALNSHPDSWLGRDEAFCLMYKGGYLERLARLMEELGVPKA